MPSDSYDRVPQARWQTVADVYLFHKVKGEDLLPWRRLLLGSHQVAGESTQRALA